MPWVLLIDDDAAVRAALKLALAAYGWRVRGASSCAEGEESFRTERPDVAVLDYRLGDGNALELLERLKAVDASVPCVILTGHGSIDLAVRAIKQGAEQFLTKPIEVPALVEVMRRAVENRRNRVKQAVVRSREARQPVDPFVGTSDAVRVLAERAARVAASDAVVLLLGETGSGKGVLASWIHRNGLRAEEPFVDLNCASFARDFLESELFGHEKGAFTGATSLKPGLLELADRGTVFLDEIGDMDPQVQPKLLKVLEERRLRRLGGVKDRDVDMRLIAATRHDLGALVNENRFRSDLYYRISAVPLAVPPLRDRSEDIPILAKVLVDRVAAELGAGAVTLHEDALSALQRHAWPGNVRELRNVLERSVLLSGKSVIRAADLLVAGEGAPAAAAIGSPVTLAELERRHIEAILRREKGRVEPAARLLGVSRSSLYERIRRLGIEAPEES